MTKIKKGDVVMTNIKDLTNQSGTMGSSHLKTAKKILKGSGKFKVVFISEEPERFSGDVQMVGVVDVNKPTDSAIEIPVSILVKESKKLDEHDIRTLIRSMIEQESDKIDTEDEFDNIDIEEMSSVGGMGGADGYQTPAAFVGTQGRARKSKWHKNVTGKLGYVVVGDEEDADQLEPEEDVRDNWVGKKSTKQLGEGVINEKWKEGEYVVWATNDKNTGEYGSIIKILKKKVDGVVNIVKSGRAAQMLQKKLQNKYDYVGIEHKVDYEKTYGAVKVENINEGDDEIAKIWVGKDPYWLRKMGDTTHFYMANSLKGIKSGGWVYHVGQVRDELYYNDIIKWLRGAGKINGKKYKSFVNVQESINELKIDDTRAKSASNFIAQYIFGFKNSLASLKKIKPFIDIPDAGYGAYGEVFGNLRDDIYIAIKRNLSKFEPKMESLKENRRGAYQIYKEDESMNSRQKIGTSIKRMRSNLKELNKEVALNLRLKTESGIDTEKYWKRTRTDLIEIAKHLYNLQEKLRRF